MVCVTPSHQFPTGGILPLARRLELLRFAERENALILEDDYGSEFRFDGCPIESLQGLDRTGRVLYVGTASKMLFPSLRLGWLAALGAHLGERAIASGTDAGLHVMLWLPALGAHRVPALCDAARARGVGVYEVTPLYRQPPAQAALLLGYATLTEQAIADGVARPRAGLRGSRRWLKVGAHMRRAHRTRARMGARANRALRGPRPSEDARTARGRECMHLQCRGTTTKSSLSAGPGAGGPRQEHAARDQHASDDRCRGATLGGLAFLCSNKLGPGAYLGSRRPSGNA